MTELIPKGRIGVKGDSGKGTDKRSIPTAQNQVYVRMRAPYEVRLETDRTRPHRMNRPYEDFGSLPKE